MSKIVEINIIVSSVFSIFFFLTYFESSNDRMIH